MNLAARALFIFLLIVCAQGATPDRSSAIEALKFDLDGDGLIERIRLDKESDPALSVWHGKRVLWRGVPASWRPWKLAVADVDGDGFHEIAVGVYKATRYFPKPHNCLFIYAWDGRSAQPKWLGSSLSRPFLDFAFVDSNGDGRDELIAIETKRDGRRCAAAYSWNGFGFTLDWQRGDWQEAALIEVAPGRIIIEADGERLTLTTDEVRDKS
jgi:hypothetical protein